jgi:glycosyltransferase involved in cell wall biosynthesis
MRFLFIEPFFGGSHRDFAQGLVGHSRHRIDLITLPARFWKWRMRGASLYLMEKIGDLSPYNGLITTDLMSLSDFKMLTGTACPPTLVYFHENQITYPLAPGEARDVQFGFTDMTTALAADRILFNSDTHRNEFFAALPRFIRMMPEYHPMWVVDAIRAKAGMLHPGCRFPPGPTRLRPHTAKPPLIVWNHRWEYDKNPEQFFSALYALCDRGVDFRLALLGENFQAVPKPFVEAKKRLAGHIVCYGHERSRSRYRDWLRQGAVVVSTARQENFGISVVEAIRHGCLPLLPCRLAYPEVLPEPFHPAFLYRHQDELVEKLQTILLDLPRYEPQRRDLARAMDVYSWHRLVPAYDDELAALATTRHPQQNSVH